MFGAKIHILITITVSDVFSDTVTTDQCFLIIVTHIDTIQRVRKLEDIKI